MEEYNDLVYCKEGHKITYDLMHSGEMCYELEQLTDIVGLMPDPHLVGAGYSRFKPGSDLKPESVIILFTVGRLVMLLRTKSDGWVGTPQDL